MAKVLLKVEITIGLTDEHRVVTLDNIIVIIIITKQTNNNNESAQSNLGRGPCRGAVTRTT